MSNYKFGRLKVKNFKSYTDDYSWDFTNNDIVILDGPNGFGKTTLFDAIELSLTGKVSRFESIKGDDKSKSRNMLVSSNSLPNEPAFIALELLDGDTTQIIFTRIESKKGKTKEWKNHISRALLNNWPDTWPDNIEDKTKDVEISNALNNILNYQELEKMFTVLNYIQQEETLHFLKLNEKDRFSHIDHLFGVSSEKDSLERLATIKSKVSIKINDLKNEIADKELELKDIKETDINASDNGLSGKTIQNMPEKITINKLNEFKQALDWSKKILCGEDIEWWTLVKKR